MYYSNMDLMLTFLLHYLSFSEPSTPPTNVTAVALDPTVIKVTWNQPGEETLNGRLVGYRIKYSTGDFSDTHDTDGSMRQVHE